MYPKPALTPRIGSATLPRRERRPTQERHPRPPDSKGPACGGALAARLSRCLVRRDVIPLADAARDVALLQTLFLRGIEPRVFS